MLINTSILKLVAVSAMEEELWALFQNGQSVQELQMSLDEMELPQIGTDIICENVAADGIANPQ